jgi:hypothetical protein
MKTKIIYTVIQLCLLSNCFSHSKTVFAKYSQNTAIETITIDSVVIVNDEWEFLLTRFIMQNIDSKDTGSYLSIHISDLDTIKNTFIIVTTVLNDLENELHMAKEEVSCFMTIDNFVVLIRDLGSSEGVIFSRSDKQKTFTYKRRELLVIGKGKTSTHAAYRIKIARNSNVKIRKIFYIRHPISKINKILYRLRLRKLSI